jgi:Family of unknown function (DUF5343)
MATLPYIATPGNIGKALLGIKAAATPPRVGQDFVKTILKISGGSGNQMTSYFRKMGFVNDDGTPSETYKKFRNAVTEGAAVAMALRVAYKPLYVRNEYMHELADASLRGLIVEETGWGKDAKTVSLTVACIKQLKGFAKWDVSIEEPATTAPPKDSGLLPATTTSPGHQSPHDPARTQQFRMQLGYTINLNLPATSDVAVFNAIFKSLKDNLLN